MNQPSYLDTESRLPANIWEGLGLPSQGLRNYNELTDITFYLEKAVRHGASDVVIKVGNPMLIKHDRPGRIAHQDSEINLSPIEVEVMLRGIMTDDQQKRFDLSKDGINFRYKCEHGAFRVSACKERRGPYAVFRHIPTDVPTVDDITDDPLVKESLKRMAEARSGLVIVCGETGSGKSTTLAATINHINQNSAKHILTFEDPIEFEHPDLMSCIEQRELGETLGSFESGGTEALRQAPKVILLGEIRTYPAIQAAIRLAQTGHVVYTTVHADTASQAIDRILQDVPEGEQLQARNKLATNTRFIMAQRLVPNKDNSSRILVPEFTPVTPGIQNLIIKAGENSNFLQGISDAILTNKAGGAYLMKSKAEQYIHEGKFTREAAKDYLGFLGL